LEASHEGFSAGALAALRTAKDVVGTLTDRIRVPDQFIIPIEAALGHHLQVVLTEQPESAHQILSDLSTNKRGRASVASLGLLVSAQNTGGNGHADAVALISPGTESNGGNGHDTASAGVVATSVIEADEGVRPLLVRLLGKTLIVPDLAAATSAWRQGGGSHDYVTQGGDLLTRQGVFTGGSTNGSGKAPSSILGRKNQIVELQAQTEELQVKTLEVSRQKGALQSEQTALQASLQEAQTELRAQEVAIATRQGEFNALQNAQRVLHQKIDTVVYEIQSLAGHQKQSEEKRGGLASRLGQLEAQEAAAQQRLASLTEGIETLRQQRDTANTALTEAKVALATEEQLRTSYSSQRQPLERRIAELFHLAEQRRGEIRAFLDRQTQAQAEIADSKGKIGALQHSREQENLAVAQLIGQRDGIATDVAAREDTLREQRRRLSSLQEQRGAIDVELAQKEMSVQNLKEKIQQKYQLNLEEIRSECISITFAADGPPKVVTITPEEMAAAGVATDWAVVTEQVIGLQKKIDEMGPVNLVAIEEYEETEQRHQFLTAQHDDLVKAKEQLVEVINRVNTQTKEMFTETFNKIRDNFRTMFVEIFGGGKADLYLADEGDMLESGIEIVARPPGKQLQSISLLSGGEQTMTAVALLFSIYQVKPSPFCVLDELDAPLDESNINRFIRVLQRFLVHSQFVIITHNKRTIAIADVLYGITMQEHGVSKIVSVKFHKSGETVLDHRPESIETPFEGRPVSEDEDQPQKRDDTLELTVTT